MTVNLQGADELLRKVQRLTTEGLHGAAAKGVAEATVTAHSWMIQELSQPGTGRTYRRRGVTHQASAPGQPPAVDTGSYRASVHMDLSGTAAPVPEGTVATNDRRGPWLEYGTRRMAARPHFGPVAERLRAEQTLPKAVAYHVEAALRGGT